MADLQVAIGRNVGKLDTDSGGMARYSLKVEIPPGVCSAAEPELSLEYCQGGPNGILGAGWALGGISCVRLAPSALAHDVLSAAPPDFDPRQPKYTLDGAELLNISGKYGAEGTVYTTEVEGIRRTVTTSGTGFVVRESTGRRLEYGTTDDSRVSMSGPQTTREWRLKKVIDYHGNTVVYEYTRTPPNISSVDQNACYLTSICYGGNQKLGDEGKRLVLFEYATREDPVLQTAQGQKIVWGSVLKAIRFAVRIDGEVSIGRAYELSYSKSQATGDSLLTSVMETSSSAGHKVCLMPTTFGYTSTGVSNSAIFKSIDRQPAMLRATVDNVSLSVMNISGRCLADLACFRWNRSSKRLSLKTYLASKDAATGRISWSASDGPGAEEFLSYVDLDKGFPSILTADMNSDGRHDLIIPFADTSNNLRFSISQCIGTGFQKARVKETNFRWTEGSKFMSMDLSGRGTVDIVQIFTERQKLAFRNFTSVAQQNGEIGLRDAKLTMTNFDNVGTIDWVQLNNARTGAKSLVRVFSQDIGLGRKQIKATTFILSSEGDSSSGFKELTTSALGDATRESELKYHVLSCDLNGDGSQDIVLATADYRGTQMMLTYRIYSGNGLGSFEQLGSIVTRQVSAPMPANLSEGQFHVTNMNGSNYASLAFVYAERNARSYSCIFIDGKSDGSLSDAYLAPIAKDLPFSKTEVLTTDLDGTGMGDWLLYNMENDIPKIVPVYNAAKITDFLSWTRDPMGLRTQVSYGCLTDPAVYTTSVDWNKYTNSQIDGYPVIAAPNYVVSALEHRNDSAVNAFEYQLSIRKHYERAVVNTRGRGWQGFGAIRTTNVTEGVLTVEEYLQNWPSTGMKSEILTKSLDGKTLSSTKMKYSTTVSSIGGWKVYRTNRSLVQRDMLEEGVVLRTNSTEYGYDVEGNMNLMRASETQRGQTVTQSWKRSLYTTIDGVSNVLKSSKTSSSASNTDMTRFEPGDLSVTIYENDSSRAILRAVSEWSTDTGSFSTTQVVLNEHGKLVRTLDAAGLQKTITYDPIFHTFAVKKTEQGSGVLIKELTAFDLASGLEVAGLETNGLLTCYRLDGFGRTTHMWAKGATQSSETMSFKDCIATKTYIADQSLNEMLATSHMEPQRHIVFQKDDIGSKPSMSMKIVSHAGGGSTGQHELVEYFDCVKQLRKRVSRDANDDTRRSTYWNYDSRGNMTFESFPVKSQDLGGLAAQCPGIKSTFDLLNRPVLRVRPAHRDGTHFIITQNQYSDGGALIRESSSACKDDGASIGSAAQLSLLQRRYVRIEEEDLVIENIDENGIRSAFTYDPLGNLIRCVDGAGQQETRVYNARGDITTLDNAYQNTSGKSGIVALRSQYDASGHLVASENAAGEKVQFRRDAKGRVLAKVGADGRTNTYSYATDGTDNVLEIKMTASGPQGKSSTVFSFTYDHRGRIASRTLTLPNGKVYSTSISYDWQDREIRTVHPDGSIVQNDYRGLSLSRTTLNGGSAATWQMKADIEERNPFGRPEKIAISGSGMKNNFLHEWRYDTQGFPVNHSLSCAGKTLVKEDYLYNDLHQIARKHEFIAGSTSDYSYSGRRLQSSQSGNSPKQTYAYDAAGNLKQRRETSLRYSLGRVQGSGSNDRSFDVKYDGAGRVSHRKTATVDAVFKYDSFGALEAIQESGKAMLEYSSDFTGEMFQRHSQDGTTDLFINEDFSLHYSPDSLCTARHTFSIPSIDGMPGQLLGVMSTAYETINSTRPLSGTRGTKLHFTDTKGNVTRVFDALTGDQDQQLDYDDFGFVSEPGKAAEHGNELATYEGNFLEASLGIINFKGRWYDPLVGRFLTPDDILDLRSLLRTDGLNRYAFEANDPINNVDPTGHWNFDSILGVVIGVVMVVAAIAITVATGGAAAPLIAAVVGFLAAGGVAGIIYSVDHKDEKDSGKFWGGFLTTVAINGAIGAVTGAGAAATSARFASAVARIAIKAAIGGVSSVLSTAADRGVENIFYDKHHNLFEGSLETFAKGAALYGVLGKISDKSSRALALAQKGLGSSTSAAQGALKAGLTNTWKDKAKDALKIGGKAALKPGGNLGWWQAKEFGVAQVITSWAIDAANPLQYFGMRS